MGRQAVDLTALFNVWMCKGEQEIKAAPPTAVSNLQKGVSPVVADLTDYTFIIAEPEVVMLSC